MTEPQHEPYPLLRKLLPFATAAVFVAVIYVAATFFMRWQENRAFREKQQRQQVEDARRTLEAYGNGELKIMNFNIVPSVIRQGEAASICYGVSNAKAVTIQPKPDEDVWPSLARCVQVSPKKTTTYTLTVKDASGHEQQQSLTLEVR